MGLSLTSTVVPAHFDLLIAVWLVVLWTLMEDPDNAH